MTGGGQGARAAHRATTTVPIVVQIGFDPIAAGFAKSLARPGGNITGLVSLNAALTMRWLELIKDILPNARKVASMVTPTAAEDLIKNMETAATALKLDLELVRLSSANQFEAAIAGMTERRVDALIVSTSTLFTAHNARIAALATRQRIPALGTLRFADSGGLMGYGANSLKAFRRLASFVDRIFKGASPGDCRLSSRPRSSWWST